MPVVPMQEKAVVMMLRDRSGSDGRSEADTFAAYPIPRPRLPEMACDVDPEREHGQELAPPDASLAARPRERRGNRNGEGADDRALVHAVS